MKRVVVLGATSAIAQHVARLYAEQGASLFLAARNPERLAAVAADARARGATQVETAVLDLDDLRAHAGLFEAADAALGPPDVVLLTHGVLGSREAGPEEAPGGTRATRKSSELMTTAPSTSRHRRRGLD